MPSMCPAWQQDLGGSGIDWWSRTTRLGVSASSLLDVTSKSALLFFTVRHLRNGDAAFHLRAETTTPSTQVVAVGRHTALAVLQLAQYDDEKD